MPHLVLLRVEVLLGAGQLEHVGQLRLGADAGHEQLVARQVDLRRREHVGLDTSRRRLPQPQGQSLGTQVLGHKYYVLKQRGSVYNIG